MKLIIVNKIQKLWLTNVSRKPLKDTTQLVTLVEKIDWRGEKLGIKGRQLAGVEAI